MVCCEYYQVTHELMSYDAMADGPYQHTWWFNDFSGQWEKTVFFPTATTGMDTNTTIDVRRDGFLYTNKHQ